MSIVLIAAWLIGASLILSGTSKWTNLGWFAGVLSEYRLLPNTAVKLLALLIPAAEVSLGLIIVLVRRWSWASYAVLFLFFAFSVAIIVNLARGRYDLPCGCSGFAKHATIGWHLVARNLGFCGLAYLTSVAGTESARRWEELLFAISVAMVSVAFLPLIGHRKGREKPVILTNQAA